MPTVRVIRDFEQPLEGGNRKIWPAGWAGDVGDAVARAMFGGGYAEDITVHPLEVPKADAEAAGKRKKDKVQMVDPSKVVTVDPPKGPVVDPPQLV
ncbi:hypothetical protein [Vineibacter terrae]|uniref:hypothetical protein n=1 Tax=Vineibacter terrae TaxID=2586908 RepID=UPI002E33858F|nr:hypothetical protein [Vineibacter terrae]HEX2888358.1 hypothetical protein [Vineibacter terrae]